MSDPHKPEAAGKDSHGGEVLPPDKVSALTAALNKIEVLAQMNHTGVPAGHVLTEIHHTRDYLGVLMNRPNPKKNFDPKKHQRMLNTLDIGMRYVATNSPTVSVPGTPPPATPAERAKLREEAQKLLEQTKKDLEQIQKGREQAIQLKVTLEEHHEPPKKVTWKESIVHGEGAALAPWGWPSKLLYKKLWRGNGSHINPLTWPSKIIRNGFNMAVLGKGNAWNPVTWPSKTIQYMATSIPEHKVAAVGGAVLMSLSPLGVPLGTIVGGVAVPSIVKFLSGGKKKEDKHDAAHGHDAH